MSCRILPLRMPLCGRQAGRPSSLPARIRAPAGGPRLSPPSTGLQGRPVPGLSYMRHRPPPARRRSRLCAVNGFSPGAAPISPTPLSSLALTGCRSFACRAASSKYNPDTADAIWNAGPDSQSGAGTPECGPISKHPGELRPGGCGRWCAAKRPSRRAGEHGVPPRPNAGAATGP